MEGGQEQLAIRQPGNARLVVVRLTQRYAFAGDCDVAQASRIVNKK
jgi:hypothetical protein